MSTIAKKYIRGLTLAGCVTGGSKSYYQYDAHGNVVQLTNASGVVTQSYDYDAFGNQFAPSLTDGNMFRYSGEYFDEETEFYYLRARQYSPAIGRFTQEDTYRGEYASPLSLNLYTYCYNDPVQYVDPTGHFAWDMFVDVISFSSSFATFVVNPTKENLLWAAIDAAALAIPNVSSPMLRAAAATVGEALAKTPIPEFVEAAGGVVEAVTKAADDIVAAVKQADVADDVVVKAKTGRGQSRAVNLPTNLSYVPSSLNGTHVLSSHQNLFKKSKAHIFSGAHRKDGIMNLGTSEEDIFNKIMRIVDSCPGKWCEGSNEIRTIVNGFETTIRFYVEKTEKY